MHDKSTSNGSSAPDFFAGSVVASLAMVALIAAWIVYDLFFGPSDPEDDGYKRAYMAALPILPFVFGALCLVGFALTRFLFWCGKLSRISLFLVFFVASIPMAIWAGVAAQSQFGVYEGWIEAAVTLAISNLLAGIYMWTWWRVAYPA